MPTNWDDYYKEQLGDLPFAIEILREAIEDYTDPKEVLRICRLIAELHPDVE